MKLVYTNLMIDFKNIYRWYEFTSKYNMKYVFTHDLNMVWIYIHLQSI